MIPLIDLHQDLLLYVSQGKKPNEIEQTSFEKIKQNNIKIVIASAFPVPPNEDWFSEELPRLIENDLLQYQEYCRKNPQWVIIKNRSDFDRVLDTEGLFGLILHIEGLNVFNPKKDWETLERWYDLGLRSIGPVWNYNNPFGGGTLEEGGLTELGASLIDWCEKKGVLFDCAHMNNQTFWDTAKIVTRPILVSHGNAYAFCQNSRNYTDEELIKIGETNGVIGFFLSKKFITNEKNATQEMVLKHIEHMIALAGVESIAIGSDYGGIISGFPIGMESVDCLQNFIEKTPLEIDDIAFKNAARVVRTHLH